MSTCRIAIACTLRGPSADLEEACRDCRSVESDEEELAEDLTFPGRVQIHYIAGLDEAQAPEAEWERPGGERPIHHAVTSQVKAGITACNSRV
jgi:hypothetical protein